ncbi:MAG: AtpZ/AtpI family protein [Clostridiales bacterium]|jgi:F0F1-type ATP synthase assembly protein I|nr:AtpZ/AtpI family protein [Clostridiales bacterium]
MKEESPEPEREPLKIRKRERNEIGRALSLFTQLGLTMAFCVLIGVVLGKWLDDLLGAAPWCLFIFAVFGVAAAFKSMYGIMITRKEKKIK